MNKREFLKRLKAARKLVVHPYEVFYWPLHSAGIKRADYLDKEVGDWLYKGGECIRSKTEVDAMWDNSIAALEKELK